MNAVFQSDKIKSFYADMYSTQMAHSKQHIYTISFLQLG